MEEATWEREKIIAIPVSAEEKNMAEVEAARLGLAVSAFMRLLLRNWVDGGITFQKKVKEQVVIDGTPVV